MFFSKISKYWTVLTLLATTTIFAQSDWTFLSTETIGARSFLENYPEYDGRGTVIFILDSGIDVGVPGLQKTSTRKIKILDVKDFSSQGDVELEIGTEKSEANENYIEHPDGFRLFNHHKLNLKPVDAEYLIGYLDESWFANSNVDDLNNNYIIDEQFGVLVFDIGTKNSPEYVAFVDTDADGHVDDEEPIYDYAIRHQSVRLRGRNIEKNKNLLNFALKINAEQLLVSFHFDDSGHGTHVAGIAAGYQINNQPNFNGIAPGAQIISLKIGDNSLAGNATVSGSMRSAFIHAARWSIRHPETKVVINLSYSLGTEIAEHSDIERFITALLKEYPNLVICLSAGNLGPGISTIGTPGACNAAISTGALLDQKSARDLYGVKLNQDKLFFFSSRGGDIPKPDLIAPGVAASTVPPFQLDDKKYGASMASPQVAGAAALLLSAFPEQTELNNLLIKQALLRGAKPLPQYHFSDQGRGVPQLENSYNFLKKILKEKNNLEIIDYFVSTLNPEFPGNIGRSAYWRTGGYFPPQRQDVEFSVKPLFSKSIPADQQANFYRAFDLVSSASWLSVNQKNVYIRGQEPVKIEATYQQNQLTEPGMYTGKIIAYRKGQKHRPENIEFELQNTVIIPYQFHYKNEYQKYFRQQKIAPGDCERYFLLVPPGASAMHLEFIPGANKPCSVFPVIFDPAGRRIAVLEKVDSERKQPITKIISDDDLLPGIWEVDIYTPFTEKQTSLLDFSVRFFGLATDPAKITQFQYQSGDIPRGDFTVTNFFTQPVKCKARGVIAGWKRIRQHTIRNGQDLFEYRFRLTDEIEKAVFKISLPLGSFKKFTNVTINLVDQSGQYIVKDGLSYHEKTISFNGSPGIYTLEVRGAKTYSHSSTSWELELTEYYYQKNSARINLEIKQNENSEFTLYPHLPTKLDFEFESAPQVAPGGFSLFGLIMFMEQATNEIITTLKLEFDTSFR